MDIEKKFEKKWKEFEKKYPRVTQDKIIKDIAELFFYSGFNMK